MGGKPKSRAVLLVCLISLVFFFPCVSNPFLNNEFDKNSLDFGLDLGVGERSYGG